MGYRWIIVWAVLLLSACAGEITPTPNVTPTPPPSFTPTDTNTPRPTEPRPTATGPRALPPRQQTLPPTFTPTFTPSITPTFTPSYTPTATGTPSPVPEDILCSQISIQTDAINGARFTNNNLAIPFVILLNNERVLIRLTITGEDVEEPVIDGVIQGGRAPQIVAPQPSEFPESGRYDWTVRLYDTDREDMCDGNLTSFFQLDLDTATFTPSPTATNTPTATSDPEQTEEVEITPEVRFIIVTATPEPTSTAPSRNELFATLTAQAERRGE